MSTFLELAYHVFLGIPLCFALVTFGLLFCLTILGLPLGIALIAAGVKSALAAKEIRGDDPEVVAAKLRIEERT